MQALTQSVPAVRISLGEMRLAIHQTHDCETIRFIESVKVKTPQYPEAVEVYLFEIEGNPRATQCYACVAAGEKQVTICAVFRSGELSTAEQAVASYRVR